MLNPSKVGKYRTDRRRRHLPTSVAYCERETLIEAAAND
jgi:hypothetical protein